MFHTLDAELPPTSARLAATAALDGDVGRLTYVSGARAEALERLGILRVRDLFRFAPRRYLDFTHALAIEDAPLGEVATIVATVDRVRTRQTRTRMTIVEVSLLDDTGLMQAVFFKQPWIAQQFAPGSRYALIGKVEFAYGFKQMNSPVFEKLDDQTPTGSIVPVHSATEGLSAAWIRRILSSAIEAAGDVVDPVPASLRAQHGLMSAGRAIRMMHFPYVMSDVERARQRFSYDELLYLQLALRLRNDVNLLDVMPLKHRVGEHVQRLRAALPFHLSDEQDQAVSEILDDMCDGTHVMNRLLLGDVGTGKTAVACVALAAVADTKMQAAVMAPTSVLAQQYAVKAGPLLEAAGISWALITGATRAQERADITRRLGAGTLTVVFGTHALLSDDVQFKCLSLVVIDEQHRFGVGQRNTLRTKGPGADLLVMTATPIPRTLALSVYGDLDTSVIRHRPIPGAGVSTKVLTEANRDVAYSAIHHALSEGKRAYVVCPLVEEEDAGEDLDELLSEEEDSSDVASSMRNQKSKRAKVHLHDVAHEAAMLAHIFPEARIQTLTGRMSAAEKDEAIGSFRSGVANLLVSTTVVEVGVDVPEATVMLIEDGERFGLATLHQLRGRVGRGQDAGTCYIVTSVPQGKGAKKTPAWERLRALEQTSDGFELAELDLRLRHEGEILGLRQSGGVTLRFVDLDADVALIEAAHKDASELLRYSRDLSAAAVAPLRHEIALRYEHVLKEVSGG